MSEPNFEELALRRREEDKQLLVQLFEVSSRVEVLENNITIKLEQAINEAIIKAVQKVFENLGVNVNDPADLQRFRDDNRFTAMSRKAAERGFFALVTALVSAFAVGLWAVLADKIGLK